MRFKLRYFNPDAVAASLLVLGVLTAAQAGKAALKASGAWSRPTVSTAMAGVVYLTVTDSGKPTTLVSVKTPIAAEADMHQSLEQNGMMQMLAVKSLPVGPGSPIEFSPGGYHIMLTGLSHPLSAGQTFPLTLTFADGTKVSTTVTVQPMTAVVPPIPASGGTGSMKM